MHLGPRRREVILFLLALILPSTMLVGLGLRMIAQERQLAEERVADEWLSAVARIRQRLLDGRCGNILQKAPLVQAGDSPGQPGHGIRRQGRQAVEMAPLRAQLESRSTARSRSSISVRT